MSLYINQELCIGCGACEAVCPEIESKERGFFKCIKYINGKYIIDCESCNNCGECVKICPVKAIEYKK